MKIRYIFIIALINFLFQSTWLQFVRIYGVMPNTSLILVVVFAALYNRKEALFMAGFAGVFQDLFLSKVLGIHFMIYMIVAGIIGSFEETFFKDNVLTPFLLMAVSTLCYHGIWLGIMSLLGSRINTEVLGMNLLIETLENAVLGSILYGFVLKKIYGYGLR